MTDRALIASERAILTALDRAPEPWSDIEQLMRATELEHFQVDGSLGWLLRAGYVAANSGRLGARPRYAITGAGTIALSRAQGVLDLESRR